MEGPPGFCGLRSAAASPRVRQRRTASKRNERAHTQKCATLRVRVVRGREGGGVDGFVEWGRRGWMVLEEEEEEGKERKTHTANEKNKCTMKKKKTSAAAIIIIQNKTFNSLS